MYEVQSYANWNISVTGAIDSSKGLSVYRDPRGLRSVEVDIMKEGIFYDSGTGFIDYVILDCKLWKIKTRTLC